MEDEILGKDWKLLDITYWINFILNKIRTSLCALILIY